MSEVISFRLDLNNPREAQAYEILKARYGEGYSTRQVIVVALLQLDKSDSYRFPLEAIQTLGRQINQIALLLENSEDILTNEIPINSAMKSELTESFTTAIKKGVKQGLGAD